MGIPLAAMILVAVAAAAFSNPTRSSPKHPQYLGAHRQADPGEKTINLARYRLHKPLE